MDRGSVLKERLKESFGKRLSKPDIQIVYAGWGGAGWSDSARALISVVSPDFERMEEGRRQEIVWEQLLEDFEPDERDRIDFVYTDAPSELDVDDPRRRSTQANMSAEPTPNG